MFSAISVVIAVPTMFTRLLPINMVVNIFPGAFNQNLKYVEPEAFDSISCNALVGLIEVSAVSVEEKKAESNKQTKTVIGCHKCIFVIDSKISIFYSFFTFYR
jgi:hypothetical protein